MGNPILVVMAAGMGSRYGGLKQMDAIGNNGEWLIDFSLYDAYRAGFRDVVFVVREEILDDFKETIGQRISNKFNIKYAVQRLDDLPEGYVAEENRVKPWGTGHAVYSARKEIGNSPIMAINADDYYGPDAYKEIYNQLLNKDENAFPAEYCMVSYLLKNTVTPNGHVSRGICSVSDEDVLIKIVERVNIQSFNDKIKYSEDSGENWVDLDPDTPVSLNCWGFSASIMKEMEGDFTHFLNTVAKTNPLKSEYFLPAVVESLIEAKKAKVKVLKSKDRWYGITYKEDKEQVKNALLEMKNSGLYPEKLWD